MNFQQILGQQPRPFKFSEPIASIKARIFPKVRRVVATAQRRGASVATIRDSTRQWYRGHVREAEGPGGGHGQLYGESFAAAVEQILDDLIGPPSCPDCLDRQRCVECGGFGTRHDAKPDRHGDYPPCPDCSGSGRCGTCQVQQIEAWEAGH